MALLLWIQTSHTVSRFLLRRLIDWTDIFFRGWWWWKQGGITWHNFWNIHLDKHFFFNPIVRDRRRVRKITRTEAPLLEGGCGFFVCLLSKMGYYVAQQEEEKTCRSAEEKQVADWYPSTSGYKRRNKGLSGRSSVWQVAATDVWRSIPVLIRSIGTDTSWYS